MKSYQRVLGLLLLFAFVYLMLCPYAEILSSAHGGRLLINQNDFRKTKKLLKNEFQTEPIAVFLNSHAPLFTPAHCPISQPAGGVIFSPINLTIVTTVNLLL